VGHSGSVEYNTYFTWRTNGTFKDVNHKRHSL